MDIVCWSVGLVSTTLLVCSICYTVINLKKMFPHQRHTKIFIVAFIFSFGFIVKTVYEWCQFGVQADTKKLDAMFVAGACFMPIICDLIPILTIYVMHR
jgi:hypothetical protein